MGGHVASSNPSAYSGGSSRHVGQFHGGQGGFGGNGVCGGGSGEIFEGPLH
jgi:hypothetical protein